MAGLPTNFHGVIMAKTNFQYEKRQRELEKKRKQEEKARRKLETKHDKDEAPRDAEPEQQPTGQ
jgi:hypothetical protein